MAKGLVVYDTFFGNTAQVAEAVGAALRGAWGGGHTVKVAKVSDVAATDLQGLSLLVVGSPTRAFRPTPAIMKLLSSLSRGALDGVAVACFDTRMPVNDPKTPGILRFMAGVFGYAADDIVRKLVAKGGQQAAEPAGFHVLDSEGPLQDGELDRAAGWARQVLAGL